MKRLAQYKMQYPRTIRLLKSICFVKITGLVSIMFWLPVTMHAQWRVGITGGPDYNSYTIDTHYMENWHYEGSWGFLAGVMGQYDFKEWIGARVELEWVQKNHRQYGSGDYLEYTNLERCNNYIQLPVMASLSAGYRRWRGFVNLGGYGAWWLNKKTSGNITGVRYGKSLSVEYVSENDSFCEESDNRFDFGLVGGVGIEWQFCKYFGCQVEGRCYYSTTSTQKDYMRIKDPKYNTTYSVQLTIWKKL